MEQAYIASPHWPTREGGFVKHSLVYHQADKTIASCNLFARIHLPGGGAGVRVKSRARPEVNVRATPTKPTQVGCKKTARQFTSGGQSHHGLKRTRTYPLSLLGEGWGEGEIPNQIGQLCTGGAVLRFRIPSTTSRIKARSAMRIPAGKVASVIIVGLFIKAWTPMARNRFPETR